MGRRQKQRDRELGRIPPQEKGPQELLGERRIIKSVTRQEFEERKNKKDLMSSRKQRQNERRAKEESEKETSEISIGKVAKFIGYCFVALIAADVVWFALSFVARLFGVDLFQDEASYWRLLSQALKFIR